MTDFKDPRITKYLLNEMVEGERAQFEKDLEQDSSLRSIVDELAPLYSSIAEELSRESLPVSHVDLSSHSNSLLKNFLYVFAPTLAVASLVVALYLPQNKTELAPIVVSKESTGPVAKLADSTSGKITTQEAEAPKSGILGAVSSGKSKVFAGRGSVKGGSLSMKKMVGVGSYHGLHYHSPEKTREGYDKIISNDFVAVLTEALSTFSIDVDTASYANLRRFLNRGDLPPKDAIRIEEMINYFSYNYKEPSDGLPFSVDSELTTAPWNKEHNLLRIGLKGKSINWKERKPSNLVFLLDVSGSMSGPNRLPLVKQGLRLMVENLNKSDRVSIVVFAGASGLVLPPTKGSDKEEILAAFDRLEAGGSTNGGDGINLAYKIAQKNFIKGGINRVILATDGDFNVGTTSRANLDKLIVEKAKSKVFLTVLGFGEGNLQDSQMESLANKGNGNYFYIDSYKEAKKVLVEQVGGNMITIAKDVKIQVEFNPGKVEAYRLIGYENRKLNKEDFNDDKKDAGEIGAGHYVTALYEIIPKGKQIPHPQVDSLKYQKTKGAVKAKTVEISDSKEWLTVKIRYKAPNGGSSKKIEFPLESEPHAFSKSSEDTRFAASVAGFGMLLRSSKYAGGLTYESLLRIAKEAKGEDLKGHRKELIELIEKARKTVNH